MPPDVPPDVPPEVPPDVPPEVPPDVPPEVPSPPLPLPPSGVQAVPSIASVPTINAAQIQANRVFVIALSPLPACVLLRQRPSLTACRLPTPESWTTRCLCCKRSIFHPPGLAPQAYNPPFREYQLWLPAACPTVTGMYPNYQDGGASLVHNIVRLFKVRAISLRVSSSKADHPICEFILHDSSPQTRFIRAMKDSKWEFYQAGLVQPFERPDRYTSRLVRERVDLDMALAYCEGLGIEARSSRFWATDNVTNMKIRA